MKKKVIITIIIAIVIAGFGIYKYFITSPVLDFELETVATGTVVRIVSETGVVESSEKIDLSFKNSGIIKTIYVSVGDKVSKGDRVAKLDTADLSIQLSSAKAAIDIVQAQYDKLIAGASKEEIDVAETGVLNAQIELDNAEQNLKDVKDVAETGVLNAQIELDNAEQNLKDVKIDADEDIDQAYEDALSTLDDAYLKLYNAYNEVSLIKRTYFLYNDQEGIIVTNNRDNIKIALDQAETYINNVKSDTQNTINIDTALSEVKQSLENTKDALTTVRNTTEVVAYRDKVSDTDKTSLDNHRSYINLEYTDVINAQQTISLTKVTNGKNINTAQARISTAEVGLEKTQNQNEKNINTAQARISTAEVGLEKTQNQLDLLKAGPRQEDINLYLAKIDQAQADIDRVTNAIKEATLTFPRAGQVTEVYKREGEAAKQTEPVVAFLPSGPFQVKVDIYEEDVVHVELGDAVVINLVAFPGQSLDGGVTTIDPVEKLIAGVVYYETTIDFKQTIEGIKPGMTADIEVITDKKENVIVVPKHAVGQKNGKTVVNILKNGIVTEQIIQTGLIGDELIEVVSGLREGEQIVVD